MAWAFPVETGARRQSGHHAGGNKETYAEIQPIYEAIAAKASDGKPCCTYIGRRCRPLR